jgi:hypothetical protein
MLGNGHVRFGGGSEETELGATAPCSYPTCATKRTDVMSGTLHRLYRQAMSLWSVTLGGGNPRVKELLLKGTGEARGKLPRCRAWLRTHMASQRSGERPTGKNPPASRSCPTGQRPHPMAFPPPEDDRHWRFSPASAMDVRGQPDLPSHRSGYREERDGSPISHHLQASGEDISVNVGGPCGEGCSPPWKRMGVGAAIVLGARESRVQGEGRQGVDVRRTNHRRSPWESSVRPGIWRPR